jgi:hypothetical protein
MDLRLPIGILFTIYGVMLAGYGLFTQGDGIYKKSLGININLWWGLALLVFGGIMLAFALRAKNKAKADH